MSVPVSRCPVAAQSCSVCVALQDPYCAWNKLESKCVDLYDYDEDDINSNSFLQNVISGTHEGCKAGNGKSSSAESDVKFAGSRGVQLLMLRTDFVTSSVLYPATSGRVEQVCFFTFFSEIHTTARPNLAVLLDDLEHKNVFMTIVSPLLDLFMAILLKAKKYTI